MYNFMCWDTKGEKNISLAWNKKVSLSITASQFFWEHRIRKVGSMIRSSVKREKFLLRALTYTWKEMVQNTGRWEYGTVQSWNPEVYAASLLREECSRETGLSYEGKKRERSKNEGGYWGVFWNLISQYIKPWKKRTPLERCNFKLFFPVLSFQILSN